MSLRSPLGRVLGLGSAHDGTSHFWAQRVSAIALALLGTWFLLSLLILDDFSYLTVLRFFGQPLNAVLMALLVATLCFHSSLGVQVVIEDYVHAPGTKIISLIASRFAHLFLAVSAVYAIFRMGMDA